MPGLNTTGQHDTNEYSIGRGILYFALIDALTGRPQGYRDLGNAPEFTVTPEIETLEHFSSRAGLKALDKEVVISQKLSLGFKLNNVNFQNLAALLSGETAAPTNAAIAGFASQKLYDPIELGMHYDIYDPATGRRAYDIDAVDLTVQVIAPAVQVVAAAGRTLQFATAGDTITASTGSFLTDGYRIGQKITVAGTATNNGVKTLIGVSALVLTVSDNLVDEGPLAATATIDPALTTLVVATDYTLNLVTGQVFLLTTATLAKAGDKLYMTLAADALAGVLQEVRALTATSVTGALKFVSENPVFGNKKVEFQFHQVTLKASGEISLIGDEFTELAFEAAAEQNELIAPESPSLSIRYVPQ